MNLMNPDLIPDYTLDALKKYASGEQVMLGDFLTAVVSNNLKEAVTYADNMNQKALVAIVYFVINHMPMACQGSPEKVADWQMKHLPRMPKAMRP